MKSFDYVRPATVRDAVTAAAAPGAAYLAAGTNLLDLMKGGVTAPNRLVDITHLSGLDRIEELPDGGLRIGGAHSQCRSRPTRPDEGRRDSASSIRRSARWEGTMRRAPSGAHFTNCSAACAMGRRSTRFRTIAPRFPSLRPRPLPFLGSVRAQT